MQVTITAGLQKAGTTRSYSPFSACLRESASPFWVCPAPNRELSAMGHSEVTMETLISQEDRNIMIVVPCVAPPLPEWADVYVDFLHHMGFLPHRLGGWQWSWLCPMNDAATAFFFWTSCALSSLRNL